MRHSYKVVVEVTGLVSFEVHAWTEDEARLKAMRQAEEEMTDAGEMSVKQVEIVAFTPTTKGVIYGVQ